LAIKFIWKGKIALFKDIIGNEKTKEILKRTIISNRASHSYMFLGIEGIGKKLIAKEFAKAILCLDSNKKEKGSYCDKCKSCIEFSSSNNPDFIYLEPEETKIKIDQIRNMQLKVAEKPIISQSKVYVIDDADTMTNEAQNCLLKTLEEPPEYVTIILIGKNEEHFLTTIKSRCTKIYFDKISNEELSNYLANNDILNISQELLELADGSIKKTLDISENQESYYSIEKIMNNLDKCDIIEILNLATELYKAKETIHSILENINIIALKKSRVNYKFAGCIKVVEETKKRLKANSNYDMCIDNLLFDMWREVN